MSELLDRAKASLHLWDGADVEMFVRYGYNEAETAYRQAPELVTQLIAEIERLEGLLDWANTTLRASLDSQAAGWTEVKRLRDAQEGDIDERS
ncbi:hypothetical protein [Mycobacteroides abscessus]|uniref:hypothetical protein n=1 Tax=Mycobacteroides abscessus TaxID=36809 RepID=UPI000928728A|nr:hypothetical protein [Mycobacteroides abscessus]SIL61357.1 Uncharacterised protein [Mycobacteroides abscessus subsp. abscessus]